MSYYATYSGPYLEHKQFKYIRKYKSRNGKWVYVYTDHTTHRRIRNEKAAADYNEESARDSLDKRRKTASYRVDLTDYSNKKRPFSNMHMYGTGSSTETLRSAREGRDRYEQMLKNYDAAPIVKNKTQKGKDAVKNLVNKLSKRR